MYLIRGSSGGEGHTNSASFSDCFEPPQPAMPIPNTKRANKVRTFDSKRLIGYLSYCLSALHVSVFPGHRMKAYCFSYPSSYQDLRILYLRSKQKRQRKTSMWTLPKIAGNLDSIEHKHSALGEGE